MQPMFTIILFIVFNMNKLIGIILGIFLICLIIIFNFINLNKNKERQVDYNPDYKLVTVTAYFDTSSHYQQNVKSSNGFFYQKDNQTYFVTTAHSIIDNWQSVEAVIADKIKIDINKVDLNIKSNDVIINSKFSFFSFVKPRTYGHYVDYD